MKPGQTIKIRAVKHGGIFHREWESSLVLHAGHVDLIIANNHTKVTEADGRTWLTEDPAIIFFSRKYWFNIVCMEADDGIQYYCNMASPFEETQDAVITYTDYDIDLLYKKGGEPQWLDEDEYIENKDLYRYPAPLEQNIKKNREILLEWIDGAKGPFNPEWPGKWFSAYKMTQKAR